MNEGCSIVGVECAAEIEGEGRSNRGALVLRVQASGEPLGTTSTVADRLVHAARWALDLDSQYRELLSVGERPRVAVPRGQTWTMGRVDQETVAEYRKLRLGVGELVRPLLLDPPALTELYPFQRQGVEWLIGQVGGILADDMGLGKTVQVIAAIRTLVNRGELRSALIAAPKSLIATWERELGRWAPELGMAIVTPPSQIREEAWRAVVGRCHVLLTNYEQLRVPPGVLMEGGLDLVVADEAHRIRNRGSRIASGVFQLTPKRVWALTGTPIERDLEDLATLLSLVAPNSFAPSDAKLHPSSLRSRARRFVLRRRKREVLEQLPEVLDTTEMVELSEPQQRAYRGALEQYKRSGGKGSELALLTRLQVLCDIDPDTRESSKVQRILWLLRRIYERGEKAVLFSYRLEPLRELRRRIVEDWGSDRVAMLVGSMDEEERDRSVAYFRSDNRALVLLASTRVGGEGLTLVEANHVFLFNQWWNPSANDQARDRVMRIGQRRGVRVYRFCCRGTIEETLERIQKSKRELFDETVERLARGEGSAWDRVLREVGVDGLLSAADGGSST